MPAAKPSQAQISRAVKAAIAAGLPIAAVEIAPDGTIRLLPESPEPRKPVAAPKEW